MNRLFFNFMKRNMKQAMAIWALLLYGINAVPVLASNDLNAIYNTSSSFMPVVNNDFNTPRPERNLQDGKRKPCRLPTKVKPFNYLTSQSDSFSDQCINCNVNGRDFVIISIDDYNQLKKRIQILEQEKKEKQNTKIENFAKDESDLENGGWVLNKKIEKQSMWRSFGIVDGSKLIWRGITAPVRLIWNGLKTVWNGLKTVWNGTCSGIRAVRDGISAAYNKVCNVSKAGWQKAGNGVSLAKEKVKDMYHEGLFETWRKIGAFTYGTIFSGMSKTYDLVNPLVKSLFPVDMVMYGVKKTVKVLAGAGVVYLAYTNLYPTFAVITHPIFEGIKHGVIGSYDELVKLGNLAIKNLLSSPAMLITTGVIGSVVGVSKVMNFVNWSNLSPNSSHKEETTNYNNQENA